MTTLPRARFLLPLLALLLAAPYALPAQIPVPPPDRPRVLVRPATLPDLRARFDHPAMAGIRTDILAQYAAAPDGYPEGREPDRPTYRAADAGALLYLLNGDEAAGRRAAELLLDALPRLNPGNEAWHEDRKNHRFIYSAAIVYDWCHELMTDAERDLLYREAIRLMEASEYGWPLTEGRITYLTNHFGEEKVPFALAFGIAAYDRHPDVYREAAHHLYDGLVPSRNGFYPAGRHHQGASYGPGRYEMEIISTFIMTRMGAPRPYVDEQRWVPYHTLYNRRPDGVIMPEGDDFNHNFLYRAGGSGYFAIMGAYLTAQEFRDPYLQTDADRNAAFIKTFNHLDDAVLRLLYTDPTVGTKPTEELPLTRFFGPPLSSMTARTGWDPGGGADSPVAMVTMTMSDYYFGNHDHLDAGHFSVYYKGPLAVDSGAYAESKKGRGKHGGDSGHWNNYFRRTVAHNSLLVHDPDEPWRPTSIWDAQNEGGQVVNAGGPIEHYNGGAPLSFQHMVDRGKQVELLGHGFGPDPVSPDYSYLKGDMAAAYHYNYLNMKPKVAEAKRSFVFLNLFNDEAPAALLVFDRVTARKPEFRKRWLLHTVEEPTVSPSGLTTVVKQLARLDYSGKLSCQTLLPAAANRTITKIGGPGRRFWTESAQTNWALKKEADLERFEAGNWRIELSPDSAAATDHFFNVIQVMDGDADPAPTELLETPELVGVRLRDRACFFARGGERLDGESRITLDLGAAPGPVRLLIADLAAGQWSVTGADGRSQSVTVSAEEGIGYWLLEGGGSVTLAR